MRIKPVQCPREAAPLCPQCELRPAEHYVEGKAADGRRVAFPTCLACLLAAWGRMMRTTLAA